MKHKDVLRARRQLLRQLPNAAEILRGSLLRRRIRHRRGCPKCARGGAHPVWVLTISYRGGKNKQISLTAEQRRQVERWLANYRALRQQLEAICELNHELLRPDN
jgi:hypothetical protein